MRWCMYIKARHGQRTRKQEIGQIARLEQIEMRMVRWMVSKDVEEREKWGGGGGGGGGGGAAVGSSQPPPV